MEAQQKELFRKAILQVMDSNRTRYGLGVVALGHHLPMFGFNQSMFPNVKAFRDAILDELQYLEDKHLVEEALKVVSRENRAWRISDTGIAFLDSNP